MNIFEELYKRSNKQGKVTWKKLKEIEAITGMDTYNLSEIRKIFHLMADYAKRHKPINPKAPIGNRGNCIDWQGNLLTTGFRRSVNWNTWSETVPTLYYAKKEGKNSRTYKWDQYQDIYNFFGDRRINVIWINQHTIPKYDPKSLSLSMDKTNDHTNIVQPLLKERYLVLRAEYAGEDQYEIVVITRRYIIKIS